MNAIDYVKQNGIEKARIHLEKMKAERWINSFFNDLKKIVDAWWLVEKFGGLNESRKYVDNRILPELSRAINLVEQCL